MTPRLRRLSKWIGYPLFALVALLVSFYATFPYERVKSLIEDHLSASGEMTVSIGELESAPLFGLTAKDVELRWRPQPKRRRMVAVARGGVPTVAQEEPKERRMSLDRVEISTGLFALIGGGVDVDVEIEGLGGAVRGSYASEKKEGWQLHLELESLQLAQIPQAQALGPPVLGTLGAKVELRVPGHRLSKAEGAVEFECGDCAIGDGKGKLKIPGNAFLAMGVTLPRVKFGRLAGEIKIDKGVATFNNVSARSSDVEELRLEGRLTLANRLAFSRILAYLRFKLSQRKIKSHHIFPALLQGLKQGLRPDKSYGLLISGLLRKPDVKPRKQAPSNSRPTPPGVRNRKRGRTRRRPPRRAAPRPGRRRR